MEKETESLIQMQKILLCLPFFLILIGCPTDDSNNEGEPKPNKAQNELKKIIVPGERIGNMEIGQKAEKQYKTESGIYVFIDSNNEIFLLYTDNSTFSLKNHDLGIGDTLSAFQNIYGDGKGPNENHLSKFFGSRGKSFSFEKKGLFVVVNKNGLVKGVGVAEPVK